MKTRCECGRQLWDLPCPIPSHNEFSGGNKLVVIECLSVFDYVRREYKRAYWKDVSGEHVVWVPVEVDR